MLGSGMSNPIEVVDAHRYPNCLVTEHLQNFFGYSYNGETDVLLAYSWAVEADRPAAASVAAFELEKGQMNATLKKQRVSVKAHGFVAICVSGSPSMSSRVSD